MFDLVVPSVRECLMTTPREVYRAQFLQEDYAQTTKGREDQAFALERIPRQGAVLDIGGGRGNLAKKIVQTRPKAKVYVMDLDNFLAPGLGPRVEFIRSVDLTNAKDLAGFARLSFDCVVSTGVLEHLPEKCVEPAVLAISKIESPSFVLTAANHTAAPYGVELHLTQKPIPWWTTLFERHFVVLNSSSYAEGRGFCFHLRKRA